MAPGLVVLWLLPEHVRVRRLLCLTGMWIDGGALDVCLALPSVQTYTYTYATVCTPYCSMYRLLLVLPPSPSPLILSCLAAPGPPSLFSNQVLKQSDCRASARPSNASLPMSTFVFSTIKFYMKILIFDTIVDACRDSRLFSLM